MWLAVILACATTEVTTCDTLVRTKGFFNSRAECVINLDKIAPAVSLTNYYVKTYCFELTALGESA